MFCPDCKSENASDAKFCIECGARLERRCPSCDHPNPPRAKFCGDCGASLAAAAPRAGGQVAEPKPAQASGPAATGGDAERRQLTVLFSDLVGSTQLSQRVDPEDLREILRAYQVAASEVVRKLDGHIAQYLGDGLLVYFGYPHAHEDDAQRAVRAGLAVIAAIDTLNVRFEKELRVKLAVRVGIHTGPVVVGAIGGKESHEHLAIGQTPNLAAALQSIAAPGTVVVSETTARLLRGQFTAESLGRRNVKPGTEPMELFRIVGTTTAEGFETTIDRSGGAMVGRSIDLAAVARAWDDAKSGAGRLLLLTGDAGIGKSRLVRAFREHIRTEPHTWIACRCSPFYADTPLRPLIDVAPRIFGYAEGDPPDLSIEAIRQTLSELDFTVAEAVPLIASTLSIPLSPERWAPPQYSPQIKRQKVLETWVELFVRIARKQPLTLNVEDLHWIDQSTVDMLSLLAEKMRRARVLVVLTSRPGFRAPWSTDAQITLQRLPNEEVARMIATLSGVTGLPDGVRAQIVQKADGNPLFVEELTKMVLESGKLSSGTGVAAAEAALAIPTTLHDSLMARLDRLAPAKTVVQVGATIGRQFSHELVRRVLSLDDRTLTRELERLIDAEIIYRRGEGTNATYTFKHALIQDAAYQSLTRRTRRGYHQAVAGVLREMEGAPPEVLAHHYTEAGMTRDAIAEWHRAGQASWGAFALAESLHHLQRALALLADLPDAAEREKTELGLRISIGPCLMLTRGFAAPEVEAHYGRVLELSNSAGAGDSPVLFPALFGLWSFYEVSAQYPKAEETGGRMLELAERSGDSRVMLAARTALGAAVLMRGRLADAQREFEEGIRVYNFEAHRELALLFGQDLGAMCIAFLTWVHAHDGDFTRGRARAKEALELCDRLAQPGTTGFVETVLASFYCELGDYDAAEKHAQRVLELANEQGMPHWAAQASINLGWSLIARGQAERAVELLRGGIAGLTAIGSRAALTYFNGALVRAQLACGRAEEAARILEDTFAFVTASDERYYEAELHRIHGEVELALRGAEGKEKAREHFERARTVALAQGARAFLRRAEESISRIGG